jgi:adenine-specific DNA methylase
LFRGLILAEFGDRPLLEMYFSANDFSGLKIADPFMGGGTPLIEANRVGCDVQGFDINPMSAWIVREELEHLDVAPYRREADRLMTELETELGEFYRTDCPLYGDQNVPVKYFLWVKVIPCENCEVEIDLFPGYLVADDTRHPRHVLACSACGALNEAAEARHPGSCRTCHATLITQGPARRGKCQCRHCGHVNPYPRAGMGPLSHRLFAIEYYNPKRRAGHRGRFFKEPDAKDLARAAAAAERWQQVRPEFVPEDEIPPGDETDRLHRWGYRRYRGLFNERQLLGLELSGRYIAKVQDDRVRRALATNLSDLLRYQNLLCRYDTMALKSLDVFSVHGFPVELVQCESNFLGIVNGGGDNVGSGGWSNIIEKYARAKEYCDEPFEVKAKGGRVPVRGEWIGERRDGRRERSVAIRCVSATELNLPAKSLDAVFTDPPYFGNVQYGELMDFCYVWLRRLVGSAAEGFDRASTRSPDELTGNATQARGLVQFTEGLSAVYCKMARALKPGAPLVFTYHHNKIQAYHAIAVAVLDAGLTCTAALPCPAEMGGSIHIHGTGSSIIDTVFVCRARSGDRSRCGSPDDELGGIVENELLQLRNGGVKPTAGDIRCILFGHLARVAIVSLEREWDCGLPTEERLMIVAEAIAACGDSQAIIARLSETAHQRTKRGRGEQDAVPV